LARKPRQDGPPPAFDEALEQVEQIIARIESGEIGLEKSIAEYERGAALIRACRETLQRAEQRIKDLTARMQAEAGSPTPGPEPEVGEGDESPGDGDEGTPF
jgi:exodeoxyribonuclease VII small subunit